VASVKLTPDELLRQVQAEEEYERRGRLKIFLGYASGVGKSFRMLDEGRRRHRRGQDVVICAVQPIGSMDVNQLLEDLPVIPPKTINGVEVMDVERVLERRPGVCLVDGLAYDNPPGSLHAHRWQDVEALLDAGISVISTVNLQFVEERKDEVARLRGKTVDVTVPESFLRRADEIVVVDAPTESCTDGIMAGLSPDHQRKLAQLREIALLLAADVVDEQLEAYVERSGMALPTGMQERILVCLTPMANAGRMINRARLIRDRFHGYLHALYVSRGDLSAGGQMALERNFALAREAGAEVHTLAGHDTVATIIEFARAHGVTQLFLGHSLKTGWLSRFTNSTVDRIIRAAEGIDVKLFPQQ
jgi:two-component system, OmpR family, sensor histidine kinase KdpD